MAPVAVVPRNDQLVAGLAVFLSDVSELVKSREVLTALFPVAAGKGFGAYRLHHVGVVVPSIERAIAGYTDSFEFHETTVPFDDQAQRVRVAFVRVGLDSWFEFIEPMGALTPVTKFLSQTRGGYHHVAFEVEDIVASVAKLEAAGAVVVCRPVQGFEGRRVAFLFPKLEPSLLTELVEPPPSRADH